MTLRQVPPPTTQSITNLSSNISSQRHSAASHTASTPPSEKRTPQSETQKETHTSKNASTTTTAMDPVSTPVPPPYRKRLKTLVEKVDPSSVYFTPTSSSSSSSSSSTTHPYDNPTLTFTDPSTQATLQKAADLIRDGSPVAFPTETVYGLGADATSDDAVKSIFSAKSRPSDNPLIVHVSSLKQLRSLLPNGKIPEIYQTLIDRFWPGALTILLPLPPSPVNQISRNVTATQPTFGARLPSHPISLALAALSNRPLAAPSANESGKPSPTTAAHVFTDLTGKIPLIIDGGSCGVGVESTVIDGLHDPPIVLRPGGVSVEAIRACGGIWANTTIATVSDEQDLSPHDAYFVNPSSCSTSSTSSANNSRTPSPASSTPPTPAPQAPTGPRAPGMKYKHYSPRAAVILYEPNTSPPSSLDLTKHHLKRVGVIRTRTWPEGHAEQEVAKTGLEKEIKVIEVDLGKDGKDIQRGLFERLRWLDEECEVEVIHVEGVEAREEGLAVMNRLRKAASVVVRAERSRGVLV